MKLYSKQLNSLEDLRREKRLLKRAVKKSEQEGFFSTGEKKVKEAPTGEDDTPGILGAVGDLLGSSSMGGMALSVALPMLKQVVGRKLLKSGGGILKTVVKEVGFSYVKWKALELGIKGVRHLIKKNKEHKEMKKARMNS